MFFKLLCNYKSACFCAFFKRQIKSYQVYAVSPSPLSTLTSLLIYQGLTPGEIADLNVANVDLDKGRIHAKGGRKIDHRWLYLNDTQQALFEEYLTEYRPRLLRPQKPTNKLLLGKLGTPIIVDSINYLIETAKPLFQDRIINPKVIRQSVIANWLNEHKIPLEQVQLMAGHKWISTTAAYRQASIEEQLEMISRFHPLR
jgi:integrase/recombinase XerD